MGGQALSPPLKYFSNRIPILKLQSQSRSRLKTNPEKSVIDFDLEIDQRF